MLSVAVSAVSLLVVAVVTVVLVNKAYDDESQRISELRRIVDQINTVHDSAVSVEGKQNKTLTGVTKNVNTLQNNVSRIANEYARKADLETQIRSQTGVFDTVSLNDQASLKYDSTKKAVSVALTSGGQIVGFDNTGGKRVLVGTDLSLIEMGSNSSLRTINTKNKLFIGNGSNLASSGLIVADNKVGVGVEPQYSSLDVNGGVTVRNQNNSVVGIVNGKPATIVSYDADEVFINRYGTFSNVSVPSALVLGQGSNQWMFRAGEGQKLTFAPKKGGSWDSKNTVSFSNGITTFTGANSIYNPSSLPTVLGGAQNYIRGNTEVTGDLNLVGKVNMTRATPGPMLERTNGSAGDRYGIGQFDSNIMRMYGASSATSPSVNLSLANADGTFTDVLRATKTGVMADNIKTTNMNVGNSYVKRGIFPNERSAHWSVYNNNDNTLVFNPTLVDTSKPSEGTSVFNISKEGNVNVSGDIAVGGSTVNTGHVISSGGNLSGVRVCVGPTRASRNCMTEDDFTYIKQVITPVKSGTPYATTTQISSLQKEIDNIKKRLTAGKL